MLALALFLTVMCFAQEDIRLPSTMIPLRRFKFENKIVGCDGLDNIDELQQCIREQLLSNPKSTATSLPKPSRSRSPSWRTQAADASSLAKQALGEKKLEYYRDFAVTDLATYPGQIMDCENDQCKLKPEIEKDAFQRTWANYKKYEEIMKTSTKLNGKKAERFEKPIQFYYLQGENDTDHPTLLDEQRYKELKSQNNSRVKEGSLRGFGECSTFADAAFTDLKTIANIPKYSEITIQKLYNPKAQHNFTVIYDNKSNLFSVDLWLLALGVPSDKCVAWGTRVPEDYRFFEGPGVRIVESSRPIRKV